MAEIQWVMHTLYRPTDDRQNRGKTTFNQVVVGSSPTGLTTLFCLIVCHQRLSPMLCPTRLRVDNFLFTFRPRSACAWPIGQAALRFAARV